MATIQILSTSDVHGYFQADDFRRPLINDGFGLTRVASVIDQLRTEHATIVIENGDFIQGSPLTSYIEKQAPEADGIYHELASAIGYDVRVLGNHEFNYGRAYLEELFADDQTLLNANILDSVTGKPFVGQPYRIFNRAELKVAVIGLTTSYIPQWEKPGNIKDLLFADPVQTAQDLVASLRDQVDVIVVAYHGGFNRDLQTNNAIEVQTAENQGNDLLAVTGIDALVTGHQHRAIAEVVDGVPTTQPGYRANHVGVMTLTVTDGKVAQAKAELVQTADFAEQAKLVDKTQTIQTATNDWLDAPIGFVGDNLLLTDHFAARVHSHPFVELVNRVQMAAGNAPIAATSLFTDEMRGLPNAVTLRDILTNYIYPNTLVVERLSGADIKAALEVSAGYFTKENGELTVSSAYTTPKLRHFDYDIWSGITYQFDIDRPLGQRVVSVSFDGAPLDEAAYYDVAMNNYRAGGAGGFDSFGHDKVIVDSQLDIAQLIADYIAANPDLKNPQPTNLSIV